MKACYRCKTWKAKSDFTKNLTTIDGLGSWCRVCLSAYNKTKRDTPDGHSSRKLYVELNRRTLLQNAAITRSERREFISSLKNVPCADCCLSYPSYCMDFDHVRGTKRRGLSNMVDYGREAILEEAAKCDVVCANCHRVRTGSRCKQTSSPRYLKGQERLNRLKAVPCKDCGLRFPAIAMDFDHVRGVKAYSLALMKELKWTRVLEEVSKCEVVCAVCHRKRTVARKARSLKPNRPATPAWHALAGTMSDYALAKQAGISKASVLYYRRKNSIPAYGQAFGKSGKRAA